MIYKKRQQTGFGLQALVCQPLGGWPHIFVPLPLLPCSLLKFSHLPHPSFSLPSSYLIYLISLISPLLDFSVFCSLLSTDHPFFWLNFHSFLSPATPPSPTPVSLYSHFPQYLPFLLFLFHLHRRILAHFHNKFRSTLLIGTIHKCAVFYLLYY